MKRARHQDGYIFRKGNGWYLRYRQDELRPDNTVGRVQKCQKLVDFGGEYRSKRAVKELAVEFLTPLNNGTLTPHSTMKLVQFVDDHYLPFVKAHKRASTYRSYLNLWNRYLKARCEIALRDFRTADGERVLEEIAGKHDLTCTTLAHIKAFLSGAFRYAKRQGVLNSENPMRDVVLPRGKPAGETYAYSLEEVKQMLTVLPEPAATVVATAAYMGARKGELRGLLWENYDGRQLLIMQSVWRSHVDRPKTKQSMAPVPVIAQLASRLDLLRTLGGNPSAGLIFASDAGKPLNLDALAHDTIRPALNKIGVGWHGWHAFRRGLATNLHRLGVPDKTIQAILRHANVAVTQGCYIKTASQETVTAMRLLECATTVQPEEAKQAPPN